MCSCNCSHSWWSPVPHLRLCHQRNPRDTMTRVPTLNPPSRNPTAGDSLNSAVPRVEARYQGWERE